MKCIKNWKGFQRFDKGTLYTILGKSKFVILVYASCNPMTLKFGIYCYFLIHLKINNTMERKNLVWERLRQDEVGRLWKLFQVGK